MNNNTRLYSFNQSATLLGITTQKLFEIIVSPSVEKVYFENNIYLTKDSIRKLTLRSDY
jgi:hypothetical protein